MGRTAQPFHTPGAVRLGQTGCTLCRILQQWCEGGQADMTDSWTTYGLPERAGPGHEASLMQFLASNRAMRIRI